MKTKKVIKLEKILAKLEKEMKELNLQIKKMEQHTSISGIPPTL